MEYIINTLIAVLEDAAWHCDKWAKESESGGWSTHQVDANRKLADHLRREIAEAKQELKELMQGN
jgi:hypothetical protein